MEHSLPCVMQCYNRLGEETFEVAKKNNDSNQNSIISSLSVSVFFPEIGKKGLFQKGNGTVCPLKLLVAVKCHKYFSAEAAIGVCTSGGEWSLRMCNMNCPVLARGSTVILMHYLQQLPLNITLGICLWIVCSVWV